MDPEDLRRLIEAYQRLCGAVVSRLEGHLAQYLGDGIVAYFGYPAAHEDDVQRAIRAGLAIIEELPQLSATIERSIHVRIGIHTGLVVVGEMGGGGRREQLALGNTPNIAARVQALAEPDTLLITDTVHQLVRGLFECEALGAHQVKGVTEPLIVHRVLRQTSARSRFEVAVASGLTPLVGRDKEIALLMEHWEAAKIADGGAVTLIAEAGLGKSRLAQVLKEQIKSERAPYLEMRCSPYYRNSAFYPVIDYLHRALGFDRHHEAHERLPRLERALTQVGLTLDESVPLLASLLSLSVPPDRYPASHLSPQRQKERTQQVMVDWVLRVVERRPLLLVCEDLHWADASTVELLSMLVERARSSRLLLLFAARPEFVPPWLGRPQTTAITLSRMADAEVSAMVERVAGGELPAQVARLLASKSDGVPLYVEELTKNVLESGILRQNGADYELVGPLPPLAIPATLQDSLMARLDRLSTTREVAQLGSVLGREFSYALIRAVSELEESALTLALTSLVGAGILFQHEVIPKSRYVFKHALLQDAAYESLLRSMRQQYHQRVATALDERFPEIKAERPELLAHHYTRAGLTAQAIRFWHAAGQRSIERSANIEALSHLGQALNLLNTLRASPERDQQELGLQIVLGVAWMAVKGYSAPELEKAYGRALEICEKYGESPQTFPVMMGLWAFYLVRGQIRTAQKVAAEAFELADRLKIPALQMEADLRFGISRLMMGRPLVARQHLERALALWVPQEHRGHALIYGQDPGMAIHAYLGWCLIELGCIDEGLRLNRKALDIAKEHAHPLSAAFGQCFLVRAHLFRGEFEQAHRLAEEMVQFSAEQDFPLWVIGGKIVGGMAQVQLSPQRDTIDELRRQIETWFTIGAGTEVPFYTTAVVKAEARLGNRDAAMNDIERSLASVRDRSEFIHEPEILRLQGELASRAFTAGASRDPREAETILEQTLELSRERGMKLAELRTAISLGRLWHEANRDGEAYAMLSDLYESFTEGFETAPLKEAKALLQDLAPHGESRLAK
jgi:class 3 adenylate cyclase/tetratricopeptide (TPR) repeat protein